MQLGATPIEAAVALTKQISQLQMQECRRQCAMLLERERQRSMQTMKEAVLAAQQAAAEILEKELAALSSQHIAAATIQARYKQAKAQDDMATLSKAHQIRYTGSLESASAEHRPPVHTMPPSAALVPA